MLETEGRAGGGNELDEKEGRGWSVMGWDGLGSGWGG